MNHMHGLGDRSHFGDCAGFGLNWFVRACMKTSIAAWNMSTLLSVVYSLSTELSCAYWSSGAHVLKPVDCKVTCQGGRVSFSSQPGLVGRGPWCKDYAQPLPLNLMDKEYSGCFVTPI